MFWVTDLGWLMGPDADHRHPDHGRHRRALRGHAGLPEAGPPVVAGASATGSRTSASRRPRCARSCRTARTGSPRHDLSALRIIGSTGEPWNPEPYRWLFEHAGQRRVPIINYTGGTEISGGILACFPIAPIKPCAFNGPIPGMAAECFGDAGKPVRGRGGRAGRHATVAGHDRRLLAGPRPVPRDVLVALAGRVGARRLGLRRRRRLLVHPRALRRHPQDRRQARGAGRGRVGPRRAPRGDRGRRHRRAPRGEGRDGGVLRGAAARGRAERRPARAS